MGTTEQLVQSTPKPSVQSNIGTTEQLVQFLVETDYSHLSAATGERAKELLLDFARASLGGVTSPLGKIVLQHTKSVGGRAEASVIGGKIRTTAAYAAYANAVLDHAPELEAVGTIGPNVSQNIAAALALGEKLKAPGWKIIESIVLGFEIQARVWNGAIAGASSRGWVLPFNNVGAVATACKILDLDVDKARSAFGIALASAGGVSSQENFAHYLQLGVPAFAAVEAAEYAGEGVTANSEILEAPQGFCDEFAGKGGADFGRMTRELTGASAVVPPGTHIKKYPCCYLAHSSIDATLELVRKEDIPYEDTEAVEVEVNKATRSMMKYSEPANGHEARFSFEYLLGVAILDRDVWLPSLTDSSVSKQRYREARAKVKVIFHPEWPPGLDAAFRTPVTLRLRNGKVYSKEVSKPMEPSREEVIRTYRGLAEPILKMNEIDRSIDTILTLQKLEDISPLMNILRAG
jgi:2-methylcitrate dehydratase PrpD